ncbi:hypothetical protein AAP_00484 [Ascosphaera apis ARSEF 7405]|uniref:25S rRNA adenine-N(1) methyltransferase n=1 Tax=Ascosphaera apis ARSEF 7405 TaxID=392613 RepID=A0A168DXG8_9EURO|nr:hypothetical protein AAP_00484 [Ascosphaera apis ARSEF 7405]
MALTKKKSRQKQHKKLGSLSHGRPPTIRKAAPSLSAKATRTLIRSHHQLHKARAQAVANNDAAAVREIDQKIEALGGLESYQLASKKGQSKERGGDSSKVLLEWLQPTLKKLKGEKLRVLEVGALSTTNACSLAQQLQVTRIDLHSQEKGILQQDFMKRPLPTSDADKFHIISLSLVLNYVPEPAGRGEMLLRTTRFLDATIPPSLEDASIEFKPCLFLVLPAACVLNSRYLTEERLSEIMNSIGYSRTQRKVTEKLIYHLWEYDTAHTIRTPCVYKKDQLNPGKIRNNFCVTLNLH